jgi:hypothetical protein
MLYKYRALKTQWPDREEDFEHKLYSIQPHGSHMQWLNTLTKYSLVTNISDGIIQIITQLYHVNSPTQNVT